MRIITLNVNGIRAAERRGLAHWLARGGPWDVVCLQEIRASHDDIPRRLLAPRKAHAAFHPAERSGYAGVALYAHAAPRVETGFGSREFDAEGRYVEARFDHARRRFSVISCYFPSGSAGEHRQLAKYRFLDVIYTHLLRLKEEREFILVGDINIAHREIDLKNWRSNQKNSGFLPEERAWLDDLFGRVRWVDGFRAVDERPEQYTWWSNRGQAWKKNVGWRIDYQIATPGVAKTAKKESIYKAKRFSDHAPLTIDYDYKL